MQCRVPASPPCIAADAGLSGAHSVIVVDASAVLETLLRTPAAAMVERRLFDRRETLHAPHLLDVEVAQVIRRYARAGEIEAERGSVALADLADFPVRRYPHDLLLPRMWELRANLTAYEAVYVALAEALDAPLVTRDRRLAAAPGHRARVEVV
jgi:predicted nucleic acid-binding protein